MLLDIWYCVLQFHRASVGAFCALLDHTYAPWQLWDHCESVMRVHSDKSSRVFSLPIVVRTTHLWTLKLCSSVQHGVHQLSMTSLNSWTIPSWTYGKQSTWGGSVSFSSPMCMASASGDLFSGFFFRPGIRLPWFLKNQVNLFVSPHVLKGASSLAAAIYTRVIA